MKKQIKERDELQKRVFQIFDDLFVMLQEEESILKVVTNHRNVVVGFRRHKRAAINGHFFGPIGPHLTSWMKRGETRRYTSATFCISGEEDLDPELFNTFCGLPIEQQYDFPLETRNYIDMSAIQPALDHQMLIVGRDQALFDLSLNYMADMVQNPHLRPSYAWVILGEQGSGRSGYFQRLFVPLLGNDDPGANRGFGRQGLYVSLQDASDLTTQFNALSLRRVAIFLDEQDGNKDDRKGSLFKARAFIKNFITRDLQQGRGMSKLLTATLFVPVPALVFPKLP